MPSTDPDHPLIGVEPARTTAAGLYLVLGALVAAADVAHVSGGATLTDVFFLTSLIVPYLYALANGGPLLAFLLSQQVAGVGYLGDLIGGGSRINPDAALFVLLVGASAAAIAVYTTGVHREDQYRPVGYDGLGTVLVAATGLAVATGLAWTLTWPSGPAFVSELFRDGELLPMLVVPAAALGSLALFVSWGTWLSERIGVETT